MIASFPAPVLSVATDAVKDLEGSDALSGLWMRESPFARVRAESGLTFDGV